MRSLPAAANLGADIRYALRSWRRQPALSLTLVCSLALGLGLGAAVFAFADGYLFRPLPFPSPDQLFVVRKSRGPLLEMETTALERSAVADFGFVEWSAGRRVHGSEMIVDGRTVHFWANDVTPGFGQTLQLPLTVGRLFDAADHRDGSTVPAWINHAFWQREFGGDPRVLNQSFRVGGEPPVTITIVGILSRRVASFDGNNPPPDLVVPALVQAPATLDRNHWSFPIVRLPGTMTRVEGEARISAALQAVAPGSTGQTRVVKLQPLYERQVAGGAPTARVLFAGALLVLLLVSINVTHLLLARGAARAGEIVTRTAIGASRWRIVRLFLVESLLFGIAGIGGGLMLGSWLSR